MTGVTRMTRMPEMIGVNMMTRMTGMTRVTILTRMVPRMTRVTWMTE